MKYPDISMKEQKVDIENTQTGTPHPQYTHFLFIIVQKKEDISMYVYSLFYGNEI